MVVSHRKWASFLRVIILVCRSAVEIESTTLTEKRQGRSCNRDCKKMLFKTRLEIGSLYLFLRRLLILSDMTTPTISSTK